MGDEIFWGKHFVKYYKSKQSIVLHYSLLYNELENNWNMIRYQIGKPQKVYSVTSLQDIKLDISKFESKKIIS